MSETIDQAPPLAPPETEAQETVAAETVEETPAKPDWSGPLQKEQEKRANLERSIDSIKESIKALAERPQTAAVKEEVDELLEEAKALDQYVPGISGILQKMQGKAVKEAKEARAEAKQLRELLDSRGEFETYMADKPPAFRKDYAEAQAEIMKEAEDAGDKVTPRELRLAMGQWAKQWFKENGIKPKESGGKSATGRPIIPTGSGARGTGSADPLEVLRAGRLPDGKGGSKPGNLLGI